MKKSNLFLLDGNSLTTNKLYKIIKNNNEVGINSKTQEKIKMSRTLLIKLINENRIIYGVNNSMGGFVDWVIPNEKAGELQENLIAAVSTNVGNFFEDNVVKAIMLSRLNSLAKGYSAISTENFEKYLLMYNRNVLPCIPSQGSLGASGDLGPLAAIALVATGKWKAKFQNKIMNGKEALKKANIPPMKLSFKEGLSLINGTSAMVGLSALLIEDIINVLKIYDLISCLSFEALLAKKKPFNPIVHKKKNHSGQLIVAQNFWKFLQKSKMIIDEDELSNKLHSVQSSTPLSAETSLEDAYSIRCSPQILGPIRDSIKNVQQVIINELNSCNDNPIVIPEKNDVFHNGHFHGQYISMAMDQLSIALTSLSNLSDRRIDRFMDQNNSNKLPPFLCAENPGLRLGLMGGQFMSTSITAENRSLCTPLSIQTLTSTGDFQDIVSMGLIAARRAKEIYNNAIYIIAFEALCAAQGAEIRGINLLSPFTKELFCEIRKIVPYISQDIPLTDYIEELASCLKSGIILHKIEEKLGEIIF